MPHRYKEAPPPLFPSVKLLPFTALREKLKEGYGFSDFRSDLMSGLIVGMVAIPLGMALAIASGVAPQHGLYTVIIGGSVVALLGGSRFQVTGPTAAFVVILAPIAQKFGLNGLLMAGLMAGILLVAMGMARMGKLIQFIPYPVTTGFTAGIAVVIGTLQLKDFFGLQVPEMPDRFIGKAIALIHASSTFSLTELAIGAGTLFFLVIWPKLNQKIPSPLVALTTATVFVTFLKSMFPTLQIATIGNRFSPGIPQTLPHFQLPWSAFGSGQLSFGALESLALPAFAIAMLAAIESLLSAVVADGMAQTKHDPNAELVALGIGNMLCPFFGGIAATGAIARTATNIRFGAKSPFSAVIHSLFALATILLFAPFISYLPMAALAALLLLVAYNMSEIKHFFHILRVGPRSDMIVLLLCFSFTIFFDMVVGVTFGILLAALLFMRKMAATTFTQILPVEKHSYIKESIPHDFMIYEIAGPLFFGAAENAIEAVSSITDHIRVVILVLQYVPMMDVTGLVALESALHKLTTHNRRVYLVGVQKQPAELIKKSGLDHYHGKVEICGTVDEAIKKSMNL